MFYRSFLHCYASGCGDVQEFCGSGYTFNITEYNSELVFTNLNYQPSEGCYVTLNTTLQQPLVIVLSQLGVECNEGFQYQMSSTKPSKGHVYCQQTEKGEAYTLYRIYNTPYVQITIGPKDDTQINITVTGNNVAE